MLKLTYCVRRRSDRSREAFDDYWRDDHGPLVAKHAETLGIERYVQVPALEEPALQEGIRSTRNARPLAFDGVAELWFESVDAMRSAQRTDDGAAAARALYEDERRFIDLEASMLWYGTEREIV